jgi:hypothetical protein
LGQRVERTHVAGRDTAQKADLVGEAECPLPLLDGWPMSFELAPGTNERYHEAVAVAEEGESLEKPQVVLVGPGSGGKKRERLRQLILGTNPRPSLLGGVFLKDGRGGPRNHG